MVPEYTNPPAELQSEVLRLNKRIAELEKVVFEQHLASKALRDTERKSLAWLEHSPVCTKVLDLDFNLLYMSNAGVKALMLGDITPYYGNPYPFDFFPQPYCKITLENLSLVKRTGVIAHQEASVVSKDGTELWFHSTIAPVKDENGEIEYLMVVSVDISERKRAEQEHRILERRVQHAQKLESLGVLSGGIAHDFNNILMSILGNADLALDRLPADDPARKNLLEIEYATRRAADLASQMLAYSGKGRFVIEPIQLNAFAREMIDLLEVSISKKAKLKFNFAEDLPTFDGDATQIRQIIMNLITNASEAIGEAGGGISLSTGAMDCPSSFLSDANELLWPGLEQPIPEGLFVYLEVKDNGSGMDAETMTKVFDPFFSTKRAGRGLGMSAVLGIVRGHKGAIKIQSEVGVGTTFRVFFPANLAAETSVTPQPTAPSGNEDWHGKGTILVADDEEAICSVAKQMLEHLGFSVLTAIDGQDAVDIFRHHQEIISCVLLDLTMPRLNGQQAFLEIRKIQADVPVILSSGYNIQEVTQRFAGMGLNGFIHKPFNLADLRDELSKVFA
ncbi:MAG: response regulator [Planctomycetes bacterium]|nr:response regulator [Planctomycetota bacterium]